MGISNCLFTNWVDPIQTLVLVGTLFLAIYTNHKDTRARAVGNSIAISAQYREMWKEMFDHPKLLRILLQTVDLLREPITAEETIFISIMITHLSTVFRATRFGEFVELEALKIDVKNFYSLPIPRAIWEKSKPLQNRDFAKFMDAALE